MNVSQALPALRPDVEERVKSIGHVDLLVGIPSFNNARTIGHVVRAVAAGLARHFPSARAVLVNSDGGSTDGTREVVEKTELGTTGRGERSLVLTYLTGPWPGIYRFTGGRLVSIERAPAAPQPPAKPTSRSKKPAGS